MFQQTFVPEVPLGRKPIGVIASLITQTLLIALLVLVPLLVKGPSPNLELRQFIIGPPLLMKSETPVARSSTIARLSVARVRSFRFTNPVTISKRTDRSGLIKSEGPDIAVDADSGTSGNSLLDGVYNLPVAVAPPAPTSQQVAKDHAGPLTIGGNVAAANLVYKVDPAYPPLAKAARIGGAVVFRAVIGVDGQVRNLQLQEGHPLLIAAARNAILQWRYRPTLLNGKPVEVLTVITVHFAIAP